MDRWDVLIIGFAGYIAVLTLTKLMVARRNQLVGQVKAQIEEQREVLEQQAKQEAAEKKEDAA